MTKKGIIQQEEPTMTTTKPLKKQKLRNVEYFDLQVKLDESHRTY